MFNNRKNKTFNYTSRFSKEENFTPNIKRETTTKWQHTRKTGVKKRKINLPLLILLLGIIIAVLYYLEYKI